MLTLVVCYWAAVRPHPSPAVMGKRGPRFWYFFRVNIFCREERCIFQDRVHHRIFFYNDIELALSNIHYYLDLKKMHTVRIVKCN